jgi:hypothetical protein
MNGNYFEVTPETFILSTIDTGVAGYCFLGFFSNSADYWLLGDVFLRNYFTIWDDANSQVGFVPSVSSKANIITGATLPTNIIQPESSIDDNTNAGLYFHFDYLQLASLSTLFPVFLGLNVFSILSVFTGFSWVSPVLAHFGIVLDKQREPYEINPIYPDDTRFVNSI